jgi:transcriptional regulator with XRE-family HTH domain
MAFLLKKVNNMYVSCNTADIAIRDAIRAQLEADMAAWEKAQETGKKAVASLADPEPAKPIDRTPLVAKVEPKPKPRQPVLTESQKIARLKELGLLGIRTRLREASRTQVELANRLKVSPQVLGDYLSGRVNTTPELAERIRFETDDMVKHPPSVKPKIRRGVEWLNREAMVAMMKAHKVSMAQVKARTGFPGSYVMDCIKGEYNPSTERLPVIERAIVELCEAAKEGHKIPKPKNEHLQSVATRLRTMRDEAGLMNKDICTAMGLPACYISNVLLGRQEVSRERIAEIEAVIGKLSKPLANDSGMNNN